MHASRKAEKGVRKVAVMGLLERHGKKGHSRVKAVVVPNVRKHRLQTEVLDAVKDGATVHTDQLASYDGLAGAYVHEVINHAESYVRGKVHTNGMENFWSLLKRSIHGTYVSVEPFHLFRYLDEQSYRFNSREDTDAERFADVLKAVDGRRVTYRELTGGASLQA